MMETIRGAWKAVMALVIPIAIGALASMIDAIGEWVQTQPGIWSGVVVGVLTSAGVYLKRNIPPTS